MMRVASANQKTRSRLIIVGKTGSGKSATGNLILGKNVFPSGDGFESVTQEITAAETLDVDGNAIVVVDTPGLFDTDKPVIPTALTIQRSLQFVSPGPHAFLIVLRYGRFTKEEENAIDILMVMFGSNFIHHAIIIWTHSDNIKDHDAFLRACENSLQIKSLLDKCGRRFITINNMATGEIAQHERRKIMLMVDKLSVNGTRFYQDNVSIYKASLERYANKWTDTSWDIEKLQTILQEQQEEVGRVKRNMQYILLMEAEKKLDTLERNTKEETERLETKLNEAKERKARTRLKQMEKLNKSLTRRCEELRKINQSKKDATDNNIKEIEEMSDNEIQELNEKMHTFQVQKSQTKQLRAIQTKMKGKIATLQKDLQARDTAKYEQRETEIEKMETKGRKEREDLLEKWKSEDAREAREIRERFEAFKSQSKLAIDRLREEWQTVTEIQDKTWTDKLNTLESDCRKNSEKVEKDCKAIMEENESEQADMIKSLEQSWKTESTDHKTHWETTDVREKQNSVRTLKEHLRWCRMKTDDLLASWAEENRMEKDEIETYIERIALLGKINQIQDQSNQLETATVLTASGTLTTSTGMMLLSAAPVLGPVGIIPIIAGTFVTALGSTLSK